MLVEDYRKGSKKGRMGGERGNYLDWGSGNQEVEVGYAG